MEQLEGLGKIDRERLAALMRGTKGTISVGEASSILGVSPSEGAKMLARWRKKGWLSRVRRGLYIPVPLESRTADVPLEDPWVIAVRLFNPCYIGGWSAAEHWDLTEQIFRTVLVMTTQKPRDRRPTIRGTGFLLSTILNGNLFGLKTVWRGQIKIQVSDPTRTILDLLHNPQWGGGIRSVTDMFTAYLQSENKNLSLLCDYAKRLGNGAVFKRLGFLLERYSPNEQELIDACRMQLTAGSAQLDPSLKADKLVTRWKLWVPNNWRKELRGD